MSSRIVITATTADGDKNFSYNYADPETPLNTVKALCTSLVTNGSIFVNPPTAVTAAKLVTVTEGEYDLS